jgi:glycosyltransferase involved in cell wall biosynthesis
MAAALMAWQAGYVFGWGIVGLNVFLEWAASGGVSPHMLRAITDRDLALVHPLRRLQIAESVARSNSLAQRLAAMGQKAVSLKIPVIHAVGNRDIGPRDRISGSRNVGRIVVEDTRLDDWLDALGNFDVLLCASAWNADLLRAACQREVMLIHEGIDPSLFHPAPKAGLLDPDRFYIFTGGKIEFRKAQDLVLQAFKIFSSRHADAMLVTAWHSPWPQYAKGFQGKLSAPLELDADGRLAVKKWVADNGIDPAKVIDIGPVLNPLMPRVLWEMDCALQPSRAEGATNLVAMEAMACGLPVILAYNTGAKDLVDGSNCLPLMHQGAAQNPKGRGAEGWGESDVEEIVAALEVLHQSVEKRCQIGAAASEFMRARTWKRHAAELRHVVFDQAATNPTTA